MVNMYSWCGCVIHGQTTQNGKAIGVISKFYLIPPLGLRKPPEKISYPSQNTLRHRVIRIAHFNQYFTVGSLPKYPFSTARNDQVGAIRILRRSLTNIKGILSIYAPLFLVAPCLNPKIKVEIMVKILRKTGTSVVSGTITHNTHIIACDVLYAHGMSILRACGV